MRIGIDARMYGIKNAGLGRYVQKLIEHLEEIDFENEYVVFLLAENFDEYQPKNHNFKKIQVNSHWYTLKENWQMPKAIEQQKVDLMHFPHFNVPWFIKTKYIVTVHDLIMTHYPNSRATTKLKLVYWLKILAYRLIISRAVKNALKVITVSEFSKQDIVKNLKVNASQVEVTYEGFDLNKKKSESLNLFKFGIEKPYLFYVGNAYPHKNLEKLLEAFVEIDRDVQLVLVGKDDFFAKRLKNKIAELNLERKVVMTGYVDDADLAGLYDNALAFVFPSLIEGFGLPPLEAMGRGLAVVSSNSSCLPEVLGDAVIYFNPSDTRDIINKVKQIVDEPQLRSDLIQKGYQQIKKYDWRDCAKKTLKIYEQAQKE